MRRKWRLKKGIMKNKTSDPSAPKGQAENESDWPKAFHPKKRTHIEVAAL